MATARCIITNPTTFDPTPPLTPPRIRDESGVTVPRLGNIVELRDTDTAVTFSVPVDDEGTTDLLQWKLFINVDRECRTQEGAACDPWRHGEVPSNQRVRRIIDGISIPESRFATGCNRVELWVSSRFQFAGDSHEPTREGDVDFATWWVFKPARGGSGDGGVVDPIESCAYRVQP